MIIGLKTQLHHFLFLAYAALKRKPDIVLTRLDTFNNCLQVLSLSHILKTVKSFCHKLK